MEGFFKGDAQEKEEIDIKKPSKNTKKEKMGRVIEPFGCAPELLIYGAFNQVR